MGNQNSGGKNCQTKHETAEMHAHSSQTIGVAASGTLVPIKNHPLVRALARRRQAPLDSRLMGRATGNSPPENPSTASLPGIQTPPPHRNPADAKP